MLSQRRYEGVGGEGTPALSALSVVVWKVAKVTRCLGFRLSGKMLLPIRIAAANYFTPLMRLTLYSIGTTLGNVK